MVPAWLVVIAATGHSGVRLTVLRDAPLTATC
jgi:hypothetical protein